MILMARDRMITMVAAGLRVSPAAETPNPALNPNGMPEHADRPDQPANTARKKSQGWLSRWRVKRKEVKTRCSRHGFLNLPA
jgi:hypothetical protein